MAETSVALRRRDGLGLVLGLLSIVSFLGAL